MLAHYNFRQGKFFGKFTDINKSNPDLVVSEGNYSIDGLKDGDFIINHLSGNLKAKGNFKANNFNGRWDIFYKNGNPKLSFEASGKDFRIIDAWNENGQKNVESGNGSYAVNLGQITWSGKLKNGRPDGIWKAIGKSEHNKTALVKENFKDGKFQNGHNKVEVYVDSSRITFLDEKEFPFMNAEQLRPSVFPCNRTKRKEVVNAHYRDGFTSFSESIEYLVSPYLGTINLKPYDNDLVLEGQVSERGDIVLQESRSPFDLKVASGIVSELRKLPKLQPALVDKKPVAQKFTITFHFRDGYYNFRYYFWPVEVKAD